MLLTFYLILTVFFTINKTKTSQMFEVLFLYQFLTNVKLIHQTSELKVDIFVNKDIFRRRKKISI